MNELTVVRRTEEWQRLKPLVLDPVSSPITKRVYNMALDEFFRWYDAEPRAGFTKATVSAWRVSLEERKLGSSSIIVRMSAIRKLAVAATRNGRLTPEFGASIEPCSLGRAPPRPRRVAGSPVVHRGATRQATRAARRACHDPVA